MENLLDNLERRSPHVYQALFTISILVVAYLLLKLAKKAKKYICKQYHSEKQRRNDHFGVGFTGGDTLDYDNFKRLMDGDVPSGEFTNMVRNFFNKPDELEKMYKALQFSKYKN